MDRRSFTLSSFFSALLFQTDGAWAAQPDFTVSEPVIKDNLAVYFLRGASAPGSAPLTLQEAMTRGLVDVVETGNVNELMIENKGDQEIFIQSGEIVKGGRQDRVLTVSLVLPPKSGRVPIASFCVEQGRWSARGKEDSAKFAQSASMAPSREAKLAMKAEIRGNNPRAQPGDTSARQQAVWASVARTQAKLSDNLGAPVAALESRSSLQLALENDKLKQAQAAYIASLRDAGEQGADIVGYVFAINGRINSGDVYSSHALFRKLWPKLLDAAATEAIGEKDKPKTDAPDVAAVQAFLKAAEAPPAKAQTLAGKTEMDTRDGDKALFVETRRASEGFLHRAYVAK
ncbi:ARPP-1 family domain-containing protein [Terrarubrum flagellatum]|uniref:ARPP-1 family domain-containing protein n=1 Tax=Terrirubrum flagellatum TaxID=2895980 RepID=UPI00314533E6